MSDVAQRLRDILVSLSPEAFHAVRLRNGLALSLLQIHESGGHLTRSGWKDVEELLQKLVGAEVFA
jgi:hypothetical protein